MPETDSFEKRILSDFESRLEENEDISREIASTLSGSHDAETFGEDEELLELLESTTGDSNED